MCLLLNVAASSEWQSSSFCSLFWFCKIVDVYQDALTNEVELKSLGYEAAQLDRFSFLPLNVTVVAVHTLKYMK